MDLIREVHGREPEVVENVEAIVLLLHNRKGSFAVIMGSQCRVHELFRVGCLSWPMFIPWQEDTAEAMQELLADHASQDTDDVLIVSQELITREYANPADQGAVAYELHHINIPGVPSSFVLSGIDDALLFASVEGREIVVADGWGSEKTQLMFFGASVLFNKEVADVLENIVYGLIPIEGADGSEAHVDL
ncbi:MAG: hypothetical protein U1A25_02110, partial [Candidatus Sungbacteria bacterium]|nr:hypothetical protein [Candidatus Sungbacteria bacterium]